MDVPAGHLAFLGSPWAITAIAQQRFWPNSDFARDYGDGEAVDCLSAIVSEWNVPGQFDGKPARECIAEEIQREVWAQMKAGPIPNLFIAGDHVQTSVDLATMEGADEAGRRAVNALLDASGSATERVPVHGLFDPPPPPR